MNLKQALDERLSKAKYTERWKGKDGKWRYEYGGKRTGYSEKGETAKDVQIKRQMKTKALKISDDDLEMIQEYLMDYEERGISADRAALEVMDSVKDGEFDSIPKNTPKKDVCIAVARGMVKNDTEKEIPAKYRKKAKEGTITAGDVRRMLGALFPYGG